MKRCIVLTSKHWRTQWMVACPMILLCSASCLDLQIPPDLKKLDNYRRIGGALVDIPPVKLPGHFDVSGRAAASIFFDNVVHGEPLHISGSTVSISFGETRVVLSNSATSYSTDSESSAVSYREGEEYALITQIGRNAPREEARARAPFRPTLESFVVKSEAGEVITSSTTMSNANELELSVERNGTNSQFIFLRLFRENPKDAREPEVVFEDPPLHSSADFQAMLRDNDQIRRIPRTEFSQAAAYFLVIFGANAPSPPSTPFFVAAGTVLLISVSDVP